MLRVASKLAKGLKGPLTGKLFHLLQQSASNIASGVELEAWDTLYKQQPYEKA